MTSTTNTPADFLLKFAKSDLNYAKKHGQLAICGTQVGNVEVRFLHESKLFEVVNFNNTNIKITNPMPLKEMIPFIAGIYVTA